MFTSRLLSPQSHHARASPHMLMQIIMRENDTPYAVQLCSNNVLRRRLFRAEMLFGILPDETTWEERSLVDAVLHWGDSSMQAAWPASGKWHLHSVQSDYFAKLCGQQDEGADDADDASERVAEERTLRTWFTDFRMAVHDSHERVQFGLAADLTIANMTRIPIAFLRQAIHCGEPGPLHCLAFSYGEAVEPRRYRVRSLARETDSELVLSCEDAQTGLRLAMVLTDITLSQARRWLSLARHRNVVTCIATFTNQERVHLLLDKVHTQRSLKRHCETSSLFRHRSDTDDKHNYNVDPEACPQDMTDWLRIDRGETVQAPKEPMHSPFSGVPNRSAATQLVLSLAQDLAEALAFLHARGIRLLNVSPANVLIAPETLTSSDGSYRTQLRAMITNIGVEQQSDTDTSFQPEAQANSKSAWMDVYSVGATLLYLIMSDPKGWSAKKSMCDVLGNLASITEAHQARLDSANARVHLPEINADILSFLNYCLGSTEGDQTASGLLAVLGTPCDQQQPQEDSSTARELFFKAVSLLGNRDDRLASRVFQMAIDVWDREEEEVGEGVGRENGTLSIDRVHRVKALAHCAQLGLKLRCDMEHAGRLLARATSLTDEHSVHRARVYLVDAIRCETMGKLGDAVKMRERALDILEQCDRHGERAFLEWARVCAMLHLTDTRTVCNRAAALMCECIKRASIELWPLVHMTTCLSLTECYASKVLYNEALTSHEHLMEVIGEVLEREVNHWIRVEALMMCARVTGCAGDTELVVDQAARAEKMARTLFDVNSARLIEAILFHSTALANLGKFDEALTRLAEALNLQFQLYDEQPNHSAIAETKREMGRVLSEKGDYGASMTLVEESQRIIDTLHADALDCHPRVADTLYVRANLMANMSQLSEALSMIERVVGMLERIYAHHPDNLPMANAKYTLANVYVRLARDQEALAMYTESLRILRCCDVSRLHVATAKHGLANVHMRLGNYAKSLSLYVESLKVKMSFHQGYPHHPSVASTKLNLGDVYVHLARYDDAIVVYKDVLRTFEVLHAGKPDHSSIASAKHAIARATAKSGRLTEAIPLFQDVLELQERLHRESPSHIPLAVLRHEFADALIRLPGFGTDKKSQERALDLLEGSFALQDEARRLGAESSSLCDLAHSSKQTHALALVKQNEHNKALLVFEAILEERISVHFATAPMHHTLLLARFNYSECLLRRADMEKSASKRKALINRALNVLERFATLPDEDEISGTTYERVWGCKIVSLAAQIHDTLGHLPEAKRLHLLAYKNVMRLKLSIASDDSCKTVGDTAKEILASLRQFKKNRSQLF